MKIVCNNFTKLSLYKIINRRKINDLIKLPIRCRSGKKSRVMSMIFTKRLDLVDVFEF